MAATRAVAQGVVVTVRLTPKGGRDAIDGIATLADGREAVVARVRTVPEKGAANTALLKLLADSLGLPKSALTLVAGATARLKQVEVRGDAARLAAIVESWPRVRR